MKSLLFCFSLLSCGCIYGQQEDPLDRMVDQMCIDLEENKDLNTEDLFTYIGKKYIAGYLSQFNEKDREDKYNLLFFRLQKRCELFKDLLEEVNPSQAGDNWIKVTHEPEVTISDADLSVLKSSRQLYYIEHSGETTRVNLDKKYWTEHFSDNTSSKLYISWTSDIDFELKFIKSNNVTRKNFSKKGDVYNYKVISKEENYYWVMVRVPEQSGHLLFKLYYVN